jgi:hypothetical protein
MAADPGDMVILPRVEYERLVGWAACWQQWWTPAAIAYRAEETERRFRRRIRAASWDLSAAADWTAPAMVPIHYRELCRRRYPWLHDPDWRPPPQPDRAAAARWAATGTSIPRTATEAA